MIKLHTHPTSARGKLWGNYNSIELGTMSLQNTSGIHIIFEGETTLPIMLLCLKRGAISPTALERARVAAYPIEKATTLTNKLMRDHTWTV